jgi:hypothetical protein
MGLTSSTAKNDEETKLDNIKKLFNKNEDTDEILESLDLTEFKNESLDEKKPIPMVGGFDGLHDEQSEFDSSKLQRKRYTKYDLFKMLKDLDSEFQTGGKGEEDEGSSLNDEESMENIKKVILKELENLKQNKAQQLGGNSCGCDSSGEKKTGFKSKFNLNNVIVDDQLGGDVVVDDSTSSSTSSSSSDSDEAGKAKKSKKNYKKKKEEDEVDEEEESSRFFIQTSESDENGITSNGPDKKRSYKKKSNKKSKKNSSGKQENFSEDSEGLSIFPFNSSDVKSSQSIQNFRNLRRRI